MGVGFSHVLARAGIETLLADFSAAAAASGRAAALRTMARLEAIGRVEPGVVFLASSGASLITGAVC